MNNAPTPDNMNICQPISPGESAKAEELAALILQISGTGEYTPLETLQAMSVVMAVALIINTTEKTPVEQMIGLMGGVASDALALAHNPAWSQKIRGGTISVQRVQPANC